MITGKNEANFHKWYNKHYAKKVGTVGYPLFMHYSFEMQIGVYLAYYDSLGIVIYLIKGNKGFTIWIEGDVFEPTHITRNEAYREAFKKADSIINKT